MGPDILVLDGLVGCIRRVQHAEEQDDQARYDGGNHSAYIQNAVGLGPI